MRNGNDGGKSDLNMDKPVFNWRGLIMRADLPPLTKLLLHTLAGHANEVGGICYPTFKMLARDTGMSPRSVIRHLKNAETLGWIERRKHGLKGSRWASNEYRLLYPCESADRDG